MSDPIDFSSRRSRKTLAASKDAALAGLQDAIELLEQTQLKVKTGLMDLEFDDLMLDLSDTLAPLEQFLAEEIKPEHLERASDTDADRS